MSYILTGIGLLLLVEGLVYALAPSLIEDLLEALRALSLEQRRLIGLGAMVLGMVTLWTAQAIAG